MFTPMLMPMIPTWNEKPPTLYSILESIVNFDKEDKTKIKDLAKSGRETIFNFTYPLSNKVVKEDFECMILNHFIMRRIGFETVTAFRIQLNVKLNEIMPMYNKMFDMLDGWDIFNDGEVVTRDVEDERNIRDEVVASQGGTIAGRFNRYTPRAQAIKEIKEKFKIELTLKYYDGMPSSNEKEGEEDVYTNANADDTNME